MDDDSTEKDIVPVVPVVEISRNQSRSRQAWGSDNEYEDDW